MSGVSKLLTDTEDVLSIFSWTLVWIETIAVDDIENAI
jgi:hypothetical protein